MGAPAAEVDLTHFNCGTSVMYLMAQRKLASVQKYFFSHIANELTIKLCIHHRC